MTAVQQLDLLETIATDRIHETDRAKVLAAILADSQANDRIDPNRVRAALSNEYGLTVYPRVVGAVYSHLKQAKVIVPAGWTTSTDDRGGNAGKPARTYDLAPDIVVVRCNECGHHIHGRDSDDFDWLHAAEHHDGHTCVITATACVEDECPAWPRRWR